MSNSIIVFAGKKVGLHLVKFLVDECFPIKHLIISNKLDIELQKFAQASRLDYEFYSESTQARILTNNKLYDWILNLWSPHILQSELLALAKQRLNIHPSYLQLVEAR